MFLNSRFIYNTTNEKKKKKQQQHSTFQEKNKNAKLKTEFMVLKDFA